MRLTMTTMRKTVLSLAALLLAPAPLALAQGTYTQIDVPGSAITYCWGINSAGDIVGYYSVEGSSYSPGYILSNGNYTTINYGGPYGSTLLKGLNDVGQIVGNTNDEVAFVYD
jgi:hypothetical protein